MKLRQYIPIYFVALVTSCALSAQVSHDAEDKFIAHTAKTNTTISITEPPMHPVRAMAEWEEIAAIAITWSAFWEDAGRDTLLARITQEVKTECDVIILCDNCEQIKEKLFDITGLQQLHFDIPQPSGEIRTTRIQLRPITGGTNRIWIRDYGAHTVYTDAIDSLLLVDWRYNDQYPQADTIPSAALSRYYDVPLYSTTRDEYALRLDGGNFLTDGMGTAFSSTLVDNRNSFCERCNLTQTAAKFMGIQQYHTLPKLRHDVIHHIDMYMKLVDEETIIFGEYPPETDDYARLEANVDYIRNHVKTAYGNDYNIIRIAMPPDSNGEYPDVPLGTSKGCSAIGLPCFRTYVNALFVNKMVLVPTYGIAYDSIALDIWQRAMPGHRIVGIDCNDIIPQYGAIHCVTKEIGVKRPLWITHEPVRSVCATMERVLFRVQMQHKTGVQAAYLHYRTDEDEAFESYKLTSEDNYQFSISLPNVSPGTNVQYYFSGVAYSGKTITRPITAPLGYWSYQVQEHCTTSVSTPILPPALTAIISPNPVRGDYLHCEVHSPEPTNARIRVFSVLGQVVSIDEDVRLKSGTNLLHLPLGRLNKGMYQLDIQTQKGHNSQLFVK